MGIGSAGSDIASRDLAPSGRSNTTGRRAHASVGETNCGWDGKPVTSAHEPIAVAEFDAASSADAAAELIPCCASRRWVAQLVKRRPYGTLAGLTRSSTDVLGGLAWPDVLEALSAHPRIGERASGPGTEASWSRREQAGTAAMSTDVRQHLIEANRAYEQQFEHVFLICATGLSSEQMLAAARSRLRNDPVAEQQVVRSELAKIVSLRLAKAFL
jgi:2-oxo-4-hydroxy-4-carboxy-5-ureidoimidazoline decarboxylase